MMGSLLLGAVLLVTLAIAFASTSIATYTNTGGENATFPVSNNQWGAVYNINAAGSCGNATAPVIPTGNGCLSIPFVSTQNLNEKQQFYLYAVGGFIEGSPNQGVYTEFPEAPCVVPSQIANGPCIVAQSTPGYYYSGNDFLQYGYSGAETLFQYLDSLHSVYLFTGTGSFDHVNLNGGLTQDQYSIIAPGANNVVSINSGLGNSTYNVVLGPTGIINIQSAVSGGTFNYYNVVY